MQKYDTLEEFKTSLLNLYRQEAALEHNMSYFDVTTSNADGTIIGEKFDNPIRIHITKQLNPDFVTEINEGEIKEQAKQMFIEDCEKHGIELIDDIQ